MNLSLNQTPPYGRVTLRSLPSNWGLTQLKYVASCNDEVLPESTKPELFINYIEISDVDQIHGLASPSAISFGSAPARARRIVRRGDVLVSTVRTYLKAVTAVQLDCHNLVASTGFAVLRARHIEPNFLKYACLAENFVDEVVARSVGISYPAINASDLMRIPVAVPPLAHQGTVAAFLDRETARIDELIGKQNALIELLGERRKAVITRAVTKGLDPTVPMKHSGVEWLGAVPNHWVTTTLKHRFTVLLGKMLDAGRTVREDDDELPYIRAANIQDQGLVLEDVKTMPFTAREQSALRLCAGDLLVVEGGAVGTNYVVPEDMDGWFFQKTVNRVRAVHGDSTVLLGHLLRTYRDTGVIDMICNKSTIAHLTSEKLQILPIAVAPRDEQRQIEAYLGRQTAQIDVLIQKARATVTLFQERRTALITAAVTGKIDVRGVA